MQFYLGIDGGGTRTRAFAVNAEGTVAAWGEAGAGNPNHATPQELRQHLCSAIQLAFGRVGINAEQCAGAFAGLAGITTQDARQQVVRLVAECGLAHARIDADHDIRIALAGGLGGRPGTALIVGTGSSCYARAADGRTWQTGGWEALISDEGSGYFLGLEAMIAAARMADGRTAESPLKAAVFHWLGIQHISEILARLHDRGLSRAEIAAFAPEVIQFAVGGDTVAGQILDRGAALLAEMVEAAYRMLPTGPAPEVVITGGLGTARTIYRERIVQAIHRLLPAAEVVEPMLAPAIGAALLAMELAGQPAQPSLLERLKRFNQAL
jgi:N-acetylglucosamine kinase-like BadF-type ATPase